MREVAFNISHEQIPSYVRKAVLSLLLGIRTELFSNLIEMFLGESVLYKSTYQQSENKALLENYLKSLDMTYSYFKKHYLK